MAYLPEIQTGAFLLLVLIVCMGVGFIQTHVAKIRALLEQGETVMRARKGVDERREAQLDAILEELDAILEELRKLTAPLDQAAYYENHRVP
jgi:hypothetical protein